MLFMRRLKEKIIISFLQFDLTETLATHKIKPKQSD